MSYADSLLASGERIVRRARQHWFVMVWNARWAILSLITAIALLILRAAIPQNSGVLTFLSWVTLALFVIGVITIAWGWLRYHNEEYLITTRRVIHAEGVVNKRTTDSSLEKINDAVLTETLFGRIFGFGDLEVLTASESGIERLHMLTDAKSFKKAMIEAKHELEIELARPTTPAFRAVAPAEVEPPAAVAGGAAMVATQPPAPPSSSAARAPTLTADEVAAELDRLTDERARGVITPEEFSAQRRALLERL